MNINCVTPSIFPLPTVCLIVKVLSLKSIAFHFIPITSSRLRPYTPAIITGNSIYSNNYVEKLEDKKKVTKFSLGIIFIYYIILLFNMVIFARYNTINSYNLIPFKSIIEIFNNGNIYSIIINIFGNLLIFMPLEYFIIELFKVKKFLLNFIISFIIIFIIEIIQYIFKIGVLDIDDLILCTLGMMLFYIIYNKTKEKFYVKRNQKR